MNYKKCVSIVEKPIKAGGPIIIRYYRDEDSHLWVSNGFVIYRIPTISPENSWGQMDMTRFIKKPLKDSEEARKTEVFRHTVIKNKKVNLQLFLSENRFVWVNAAYLDPINTDGFKFRIRNYYKQNQLLAMDKTEELRALIVGVETNQDEIFYDDLKALAEMHDRIIRGEDK